MPENNDAEGPHQEARAALGRRIKEARTYLGFSQEEVATGLGISRSAVSQIEAGQRGLDALELASLAKLLARPLEYFTPDHDGSSAPQERVALLARATEGLSDSDISELQRFAVFLKSRSGAGAQ